ncbi:MAG: ribosome maturation factor RimP [Acidobacteria bacterium]|nr:ribosome maturation factor RimP [Acidobacteriota bacterium]MBW4045024.1 ribosome maturation factor RimP [Acidobacteriota bacterium]
MALNLDQIRTLAERVAASHGLDIVEVEYEGNPKQRLLRVFIEKNAEERARLAAAPPEDSPLPAGISVEHLSGVTHDDCTAFSRDFGTVLDIEDLAPDSEYTLEVSSPGLERRLTTLADFRRFTGSLVKLQTFQAVTGNRHWRGRLTAVGDTAITLDLSAVKQTGKAAKKTTAQTIEIQLANIEKANLVPEF